MPTAEKLTQEQLQPGAQRAADTLNEGAEKLTQDIIQPEAKQLAEQATKTLLCCHLACTAQLTCQDWLSRYWPVNMDNPEC